jgi:hypothetical protein
MWKETKRLGQKSTDYFNLAETGGLLWRVSGSCRSGRYGTNAILAIVDRQHYLLEDGIKLD